MRVTMKYDDRNHRRALGRFMADSKKPKRDVLKQRTKLFVRDVVKNTPPNHDAKFDPKAGRARVSADLAKIFRPVKKGGISDPAAVHKRNRNRQGRVRRSLKTDKGDRRFPVQSLKAYANSVLARVGILASGWNAAAVALGLSLPAWISRHGTKYGRVKVKFTTTGGSITVTNAVRFAGDVRGIDRRVQWALDNQARQMDKIMDDYAVKKSAKKAGLSVK